MLRAAFSLWCLMSTLMASSGHDATPTPLLRESMAMDEQEEALRGLIARVLPEHRHLFIVQGIKHCRHEHHAAACFEVRVSGGLVYVQGTSGMHFTISLNPNPKTAPRLCMLLCLQYMTQCRSVTAMRLPLLPHVRLVPNLQVHRIPETETAGHPHPLMHAQALRWLQGCTGF